jgi:hypothetical protein
MAFSTARSEVTYGILLDACVNIGDMIVVGGFLAICLILAVGKINTVICTTLIKESFKGSCIFLGFYPCW